MRFSIVSTIFTSLLLAGPALAAQRVGKHHKYDDADKPYPPGYEGPGQYLPPMSGITDIDCSIIRTYVPPKQWQGHFCFRGGVARCNYGRIKVLKQCRQGDGFHNGCETVYDDFKAFWHKADCDAAGKYPKRVKIGA